MLAAIAGGLAFLKPEKARATQRRIVVFEAYLDKDGYLHWVRRGCKKDALPEVPTGFKRIAWHRQENTYTKEASWETHDVEIAWTGVPRDTRNNLPQVELG